MDVTRDAHVRRVRDLLYKRYRRLDALVYCAAVVNARSIMLTSPRHWEQVFQVNVIGAARCLGAFYEVMARRHAGQVVLLGSLSARAALPGASAYAASKAALESFTRTSAVELAPLGISVVTLCLGWIDTPMLNKIAVPRGRGASAPADPRAVASVISRLLEPDMAALSGASISFGENLLR
jgi:NAD(P)-dependent dehydrogenase (short-subunit alcohol dehydrogenase family)